MTIKKQAIYIPTAWEIKRNEFYDIDSFDKSSTEDKSILIFTQEDILWLKKRDYNIDLGWYGGDDLSDSETGFCIYLYRGVSWNKCELLEKFRSKNKKEIGKKLAVIITSVDNGDYEYMKGYKIDEDDIVNRNSMSDHETYSASERRHNQ